MGKFGLLLFLVSSFALADFKLVDPLFSIPGFTTAARPTCPSPYGCIGFNTETSIFEGYDGLSWNSLQFSIPNWQPSTAYKTGQFLVTEEAFVRVMRDHTSDALAIVNDLYTGNTEMISAFPLTTGVVSGGVATIAAGSVNVSAGRGAIVSYDQFFPNIKLIEWLSAVALVPPDPVGPNFISVNDQGIVGIFAGIPTPADQTHTIVLARVNPAIDVVIDERTDNRDPLGQLRSLSLFFGTLNKGLVFSGNIDQTLAQTAYIFHDWGSNWGTDTPNIGSNAAKNPSDILYYLQTGFRAGPQALVETCCYDNAGAWIALGNNNFGFARIYENIAGETALLYSQMQYQNLPDAKVAAQTRSLVVPPDLLYNFQWVGYFAFPKGHIDLSTLDIVNCGALGCGAGGGGAGGGGGDVSGPATAIDNNLVSFDGTTGKIIKDSGIRTIDVVLGPASSIDTHVALFSGTTGKVIKDDSPVSIDFAGHILDKNDGAHLQISFANDAAWVDIYQTVIDWKRPNGNFFSIKPPNTPVASYSLTFPDASPSNNNTLVSTSSGVFSWRALPPIVGDVVGPATSTDSRVAVYSGTTGKIIKETPYTVPLVDGTANQILKTNGSGALFWSEDVDTYDTCTGDVVGPAAATIGNLAFYSDITGKVIDSNDAFNANTANKQIVIGEFSVGNNPGLGGTWACSGNKVFKDSSANYAFCQRSDGRMLFNVPTGQVLGFGTGDSVKFIVGDNGAQLEGSINPTLNIQSTSSDAAAGGSIAFKEANLTQGFKIVHNSLDVDGDSLDIMRTNASVDSQVARFSGAGLIVNGNTHVGTRLSVGASDSTPTYIFPLVRGTTDQIMKTDALGNITWADMFLPYHGDFKGRLVTGSDPGYRGRVVIYDTDSSNAAVLYSASNMTTDYDLVLPPAGSPGNNHILEANQWGDLSWIPTPMANPLNGTGLTRQVLTTDGLGGSNWETVGIRTWQAGLDYRIGEIINTGSDANWLFKVVQDHTSVDVPGDFRTGKIMAIAPPIITTGVQAGGQVSLAGNLATIQGGTGYIAKYGTSPSAWPLVTIVEWTTQNIIVPSTGIHALYIDETGNLILSAPTGDTEDILRSAQDDTISVAIVDMNLGLIYDRKTFPTNPVGQLRGLSFFFGVMTKGLSYVATGLQLSRSQHDVYFWGADPFNPYNPNQKTVPSLPIANFFEFKQNGAILPAVRVTTLKNTVYDNGGTLTTMTNNRWGFIRIYSSPGSDNYIMYSQGQWQTQAEAKEAATSGNFIRPPDLELTKFSAWFTFMKGDADFSDNEISVCEPFGCDKIGSTSAGGGGGGSGDVLGPTSSNPDNLVAFTDFSGKSIKDSGIAMSTITTLQTDSHIHANKILLDSLVSNGTPTQFLSADGTYKTPVDTNTVTTVLDVLTSTSVTSALSANQGKVLNDKITPLQTASHSHANKTLLDSLISNGAATLFLAADGTYKTPVDTNTVTTVLDVLTSTSTTSALSANQGKVLNDKITLLPTMAANGGAGMLVQTVAADKALSSSGLLTANIPTMTAAGGVGMLVQTAAADKVLSNSSVAVANVITKTTAFTAVNRAVLAGGNNKTLTETAYTIPTTDGAIGYVLKMASTGVASWAVDANTVTTVEDLLTSSSTVNALSANQGRILDNKITPLTTASHTHANKTLLDTIKSNGTATEFLAGDGTYKIPVDNDSGGTVNGSGGSVDNRLVAWSGTTGTLIKDSGILYTDIVKGPTSATDNAIARFDSTTGKLIQDSGVRIDDLGEMDFPTTGYIDFGQDFAGREANAGKIAYNGFSQTGDGGTGLLVIAGGGTTGTNRSVRIWDRLGIGTNPINALDVNGTITATGSISSVGQIWSTSFSNAGATINFSNGNNQYFTGNCQGITLQNMQDGGSYVLLITGTGAGTCSFTHTGLTMHYPPGHGPITVGKQTLYSFVRFSAQLYIGWSPGM